MDMTNQEGSQGLTSPHLWPLHQVNQVKYINLFCFHVGQMSLLYIRNI